MSFPDKRAPSAVSGLGVISPIAVGADSFADALRRGASHFSSLELQHGDSRFVFPIAPVCCGDEDRLFETITFDTALARQARKLRHVSTSSRYGVCCALQAWQDAGLDSATLDPRRVAIVSASNNTQQVHLHGLRERYRDKLQHLNVGYGLSFFDTDIVGIVSSLLNIRGEGYSVGAASASSSMALIQAHRLIEDRRYDVVLVLAPMMELTVYEYQAFTALGAMAVPGRKPDMDVTELCRPFDSDCAGFVYGQNSACVVLESAEHLNRRNGNAYAFVAGSGTGLDANRNPDPGLDGEVGVMLDALNEAQLDPSQVDYVNSHGTGSALGDRTEVEALLAAGLDKARVNSTKSLIGHGLTAAGLTEIVATSIQMRQRFLHPSRNLDNPISDRINWVGAVSEPAELRVALSNSFGFGGINTSVLLCRDI